MMPPPYKLQAVAILKALPKGAAVGLRDLDVLVAALQEAYSNGYQTAQLDMREALGIDTS